MGENKPMPREINVCKIFHANKQVLPETKVILITGSSLKKIFPVYFVMLIFSSNFPRRTNVLFCLNLLLESQRYA